MSRRGNCHDNAVAESFFSLLKKKEYAIEPTKQDVMPVQRFLIISNAFINQSDTMDQIMDYRHGNMRSDILRS
jgi:transposase InsO family protein